MSVDTDRTLEEPPPMVDAPGLVIRCPQEDAPPALTRADLPAFKLRLEALGWEVSWKFRSGGEEELICTPKRHWTVSPLQRRLPLFPGRRRRSSRPAVPDPELWDRPPELAPLGGFKEDDFNFTEEGRPAAPEVANPKIVISDDDLPF